MAIIVFNIGCIFVVLKKFSWFAWKICRKKSSESGIIIKSSLETGEKIFSRYVKNNKYDVRCISFISIQRIINA